MTHKSSDFVEKQSNVQGNHVEVVKIHKNYVNIFHPFDATSKQRRILEIII